MGANLFRPPVLPEGHNARSYHLCSERRHIVFQLLIQGRMRLETHDGTGAKSFRKDGRDVSNVGTNIDCCFVSVTQSPNRFRSHKVVQTESGDLPTTLSSSEIVNDLPKVALRRKSSRLALSYSRTNCCGRKTYSGLRTATNMIA